MRYTVTTVPLADQLLAKIWLEAEDRQEVSDAANQIDLTLKNNPEEQGRLHPGGWLVFSCGPLVVTYRVKVEDRIVCILSYFRVG